MTNLRQFRHFVAVLESASLLEASRKLHLSQPALSKSISTLEEHYRVRLFQRMPRGVRPTPFARTLEPFARRLLHDAAESEREMAVVAEGSAGTVSLGVGAAFVDLLSDALATFDQTHPNAHYKIVTDHAHNLRRALLANQIECYVGLANDERHEAMFDVELLYSDRYYGACAPSHPFAGRVVTAGELSTAEWIVSAPEEPAHAALEAYFVSRLQHKARVKMTTNANRLVRQFLLQGRYLSVVPRLSFQLADYRDLARFELEGFDFRREVGLVRRSGTVSTPLGARIQAILRQSFGELALEG